MGRKSALTKGKKKNRTLPLTVVGAQQAIPAGWRAQGASCMVADTKRLQKGKGKYFYIAAPATGRAILLHQFGGGTITEWKSSKTTDAPRMGKKEVGDLAAQKALDAMNLLVVKEHNKSFKVPPFLKGTWRGYIECTSNGPHVVLYRDLSYARIAIVSDLTPTRTVKGKTVKGSPSWEWAIGMNPRKSQEWFVSPKKSYSGKGKRSFSSAFHAALQQLLTLMGEACTVKTVTRPEAMKRALKGQRTFKSGKGRRSTVRTKAARKSEVRKARVLRQRPVVSHGAIQPSASVRALVDKRAKITHGIKGLRKDDLVKIVGAYKTARGKIEILVHTIVHEAGGKGRLAKTPKRIPLYARRQGKNVRRISVGKTVNSYFDYALRHGLQNVAEVRKAKKAKAGKVATSQRKKKAASKTAAPKKAKGGTSRTRSFDKRVAAQRALGVETRYIKFKGNRHKGRYARVDRVKPNARGNADPKSGGVLMEIVIIQDHGGVSNELNEMVNGKRDFSKVTKAGFEAAKKKAAAAKKKAEKKAAKAGGKPARRSKPTSSEMIPTSPPIPMEFEDFDITTQVFTGKEIRGEVPPQSDAMAELDALLGELPAD